MALTENAHHARPVPHLLLHGIPGVGKTTAAYAFARAALGPGWRDHFIEFNGSSDRGIETARVIGRIVGNGVDDVPFRIILLDEADSLTSDAQDALRRIMEQRSGWNLFILSCNEIDKIIPALQSRCLLLEFRAVDNAEIHSVLYRSATLLGIERDEKLWRWIQVNANGRPRDANNLLVTFGKYRDGTVESDSGPLPGVGVEV